MRLWDIRIEVQKDAPQANPLAAGNPKAGKEKALRIRPLKAKRTKRIVLYVYMLIILLTLLTVASYTWFSLSQTPRVSDMYMFINSETGLELSTDPLADEWVLQLDYRDMVRETSPLRPITWSNARQQFYAADYGIDGRLIDYPDWQPLINERNANKNNSDGYYTKATFYARTGQDETVFLSPAVEVDEGINGSGTYVIGTPVWDGQNILHNNGGMGAECAIRIGIRIEPVNLAGEPTGAYSIFYIYEPNSDRHIDGSVGYTPTPSIDATATLVPERNLILQSASTWTEAYPVQRNVVIHELGDFTTDVELFSLKSGQMVKIDIYCWLEGQDVDCTNEIQGAQIMANIQFATEPDSQSGMVPIDEFFDGYNIPED